MQLKVGEKAPLFEGVTDSGSKLLLSDLIGGKNIILFFYPKDNTPGCTAEACGFRDVWQEISSLDAIVIGVSSQSEASHREFKKKYNLPFTLVSDPKNEIRKLYGATGLMIPPRVTFVIDKQGTIRFIFNSQINVTKHVNDALATLKEVELKSANNAD